MALFSRFRRNRTDQVGMPTELQDYYKAEGRERTGLAWLLALGTLLITVLLVVGLFLGGRWVFRELKNNDDQPTQVAVQDDASKEGENQPSESNTSSDSNSSGNTSQNGGAAPAPAAPPASGSAPATPQTPPSSGSPSARSSMPSTGPADNVAIFVAVSVLAYIVHRKFLSE